MFSDYKKKINNFILNKLQIKKINKKKINEKKNFFLKRKLKYTKIFFSKKTRNFLQKYFNRKRRKVIFSKISKKVHKRKIIGFSKKLERNFLARSYFNRIIRKTFRKTFRKKKKIRVLRVLRKKPIFTKKTDNEKYFLFRARYFMLKTKKYLYRKQFPKIKGKKNRNFNFNYYNNIDHFPVRFYIGRFYIVYKHNNTFINIHNSKKMLRVFSAGKLGFKGPKRSTPFSRQAVARKAVGFLEKTPINILDVYLNTNYNRWYHFILKEFSKARNRKFLIRYLIINNPRPHGFLRDKKRRRK